MRSMVMFTDSPVSGYLNILTTLLFLKLNNYVASLTLSYIHHKSDSSSGRTEANRSGVLFLGFQPMDKDLLATQRAFVPM